MCAAAILLIGTFLDCGVVMERLCKERALHGLLYVCELWYAFMTGEILYVGL